MLAVGNMLGATVSSLLLLPLLPLLPAACCLLLLLLLLYGAGGGKGQKRGMGSGTKEMACRWIRQGCTISLTRQGGGAARTWAGSNGGVPDVLSRDCT